MENPSSPSDAGASVQFTNLSNARHFILAGDAYVTFVSRKTEARFTYHVEQPKKRPGDFRTPPHFVSVLTGPEHYEFLGTIFDRENFRHGSKSRIGRDASSAKAFAWVWEHLAKDRSAPDCEIHHEGRCGRCGRRLTVPESIQTGLGPECARKTSGG